MKAFSLKNKKFITPSHNSKEKSTALISFYDLGVNTIENIAKVMVLEEYFNNKAFDFLRTKLQLGYIAGAKKDVFHGVLGLLVYVQGPSYNISLYEEKITEFLNNFSENLEEIDEQEFNIMKISKNNELLVASRLEDKEDEYWKLINGNLTQNWKIRTTLAHYIKQLKKEELIEFWKRTLNDREKNGHLDIAVVPMEKKEIYEKDFTSYELFRREAQFYEEISEKLYIF